MTELVRIENLVARRGGFSLQIPNWTVEAGGVFAVVGSNGAGKSTLLELISGLERADEGLLEVLGHDPIARPVEVKSQVGFMSDDMPIFAETVGRLLWFLSGYYSTWNDGLVGDLLSRFDLDTSKKVTELSRGEGTRIRLITAMAFEPRLLVLDEPATGLDVVGRRRLLETILDVVRDPERSVVISSHQLGDVERLADELLVLDEGRVVQVGATADLVGEGRTLEEAMMAWGGG